jgi:hypothetical protein
VLYSRRTFSGQTPFRNSTLGSTCRAAPATTPYPFVTREATGLLYDRPPSLHDGADAVKQPIVSASVNFEGGVPIDCAIPPPLRRGVGGGGAEFVLSVVVAARVDNHEGDFLARFAHFYKNVVHLLVKYGVHAEIVVVEYAPLRGEPQIADYLWHTPVPTRVVRVPPSWHAALPQRRNDAFPQFLAKNVGIRRARGEWVLVTNADILLSDELVKFIADGEMRPGHFYRMDRHNIKPLPTHVAAVGGGAIRFPDLGHFDF